MVYIIVVTYNAMPWLSHSMTTLRRSGLTGKLVVVDNGSTDGTQSFIQQHYPDVHFIQSETNIGFGRANNIGIQLALKEGAEYVLLLNQDAWLADNALLLLIQSAKANPRFGLLSCLHYAATTTELDYNFKRYTEEFLSLPEKREVIEVPFVNAAIWLIPRNVIEQVGGFSPYFQHYGEDRDWVNRLHYHAYVVGIVPAAVGYHDRPQHDSTSKAQRMKILWKEIDYLNPLKDYDSVDIRKEQLAKIGKAITSLKPYGVYKAIQHSVYFRAKWPLIKHYRERVRRKENCLFLLS
jgi:N-acetylglucosaminyl-diphospho-decaprenol L-rhamnosyltransferase